MQTPDPIRTTEQVAAAAASVVAALVVLFKLDVTDAQQAALVTLIGAAYTAFTLVHAAVVRNGRARALASGPSRP